MTRGVLSKIRSHLSVIAIFAYTLSLASVLAAHDGANSNENLDLNSGGGNSYIQLEEKRNTMYRNDENAMLYMKSDNGTIKRLEIESERWDTLGCDSKSFKGLE